MASVQLMSNSNELKENVAHTITIASNNQKTFPLSLSGLLQNGISIAYKPEYSDLADLVPWGGVIKETAAAIGKRTGSQILDGIAEQQYYTGAKPITINAIIKVIDYDGTGKPLKVAAAIAAFCQPSNSVDKLTAALLKLDFDSIKKETENIIDDLGISNLTDKDKNFSDAAAGLGRTVNVRISDFLSFPHMVIDSASQEFSFEQGLAGPVSVTLTLTLTTSRVPDAADVINYYINPGENKSRIKYIGG